MPCRNAHFIVLALLALTFVAFWPSYFSQLPAGKSAWHFHAAGAVLWTLLVIVQCWSIQNRHRALHRNAGALALTCYLYRLAPKHGHPFLIVMGFIVAQQVLFETLGRLGPVLQPIRPCEFDRNAGVDSDRQCGSGLAWMGGRETDWRCQDGGERTARGVEQHRKEALHQPPGLATSPP